MMRVMLVIPNSEWYAPGTFWHLHPYPLALLAAMLDRNDHVIHILDANADALTPGQFEAAVRDWQPDVVGVSVLANEFAVTGHVACSCVKNVSKTIVTVLGGVYPTSRPADAIKDSHVDFVAIGEGEYLFPQLLDHLAGKAPLPDKGLAYLKDGRAVVQERAPFIQDLDAIPYPAYDLIDFNRYATKVYKYIVDAPRALPYAKLVTSRGCPIGCTFCQVETISGKMTRYQSPARVVDEMEWLVGTYGVKAFEFLDDNFLGHRGRALAIFNEMIRRQLPVVWNAMNVSAFYLSEEMLEVMRASGCRYVSIAVESGVQRVLKEIIRKPIDLAHVKRLIAKAKSLGMDTSTLWVIGSPGETWDEIRTTLTVAEEIDAHYVKINLATPYPGTKLFDMAVSGGYLPEDFSFDDIAWGQASFQTEEFSKAELTVLRAFEWDRINFSNADRCREIARMMGIGEDRLAEIRRSTRENALKILPGLGSKQTVNQPPTCVGDLSISTNT
ncbi:MAG: radical SAM protein [Alphaproteobacteria bacterium]|nr:radical SAM protein [Alphaproteobacteria bacterium]